MPAQATDSIPTAVSETFHQSVAISLQDRNVGVCVQGTIELALNDPSVFECTLVQSTIRIYAVYPWTCLRCVVKAENLISRMFRVYGGRVA